MYASPLSRMVQVHALPNRHRGILELDGVAMRCALGRSGFRISKREGDGATPAGTWPMRFAMYRADRIPRPRTSLPLRAIRPHDGWGDDPADPDSYNRLIRLPSTSGAERLWREDHLYDVVVVLGHNDSPPVPGRGSACFMHLARPDYAPTQGCIALSRRDMSLLLGRCRAGTPVRVAVP